MPIRATKRGAERTPLGGSYDVLVCGASFAGLAVCRELERVARAGARVLMIDRYDVGERQTSACAAPTAWLENLGLHDAIRQRFTEIVLHTPKRSFRWELPFGFATFDYRLLCELLRAQAPSVAFETAKVDGRSGQVVHTDRGDLQSPLIVDALGWRRTLAVGEQPIQPPEAFLSRGLEVHPAGESPDLELWLDPRYVRAGYSWNFPAGDELRVGVGSFDPRAVVKQPTVRLAGELGLPPDGYQGNWIPHRMRDATQDTVFFCGDSAGHCLPATAEGIRTALYFGLACGRELARVVEGSQSRAAALVRYAAFCEAHRRRFAILLLLQRLIGHINPRPRTSTAMLRAMSNRRFLDWSFGVYLAVAPPEFALLTAPESGAGAHADVGAAAA